jgi:hypothetical protein
LKEIGSGAPFVTGLSIPGEVVVHAVENVANGRITALELIELFDSMRLDVASKIPATPEILEFSVAVNCEIVLVVEAPEAGSVFVEQPIVNVMEAATSKSLLLFFI